jgi:hypothetical protein
MSEGKAVSLQYILKVLSAALSTVLHMMVHVHMQLFPATSLPVCCVLVAGLMKFGVVVAHHRIWPLANLVETAGYSSAKTGSMPIVL